MRLMYVFYMLCVGISNNASCQSTKVIAELNNDSIKFYLIKTSMQIIDSGKIIPSSHIVEVDIRDKVKKKLSKLKKEAWMKLLHNENTDWAANLYLYEIYRKDGSIYDIIKNARDWRKCCKTDDLAFWEKELKR